MKWYREIIPVKIMAEETVSGLAKKIDERDGQTVLLEK